MGSAAENFDAYFKSRLEYYEEPPGDKAWDNIADKLGHKRRKRMILFIVRIAAGMLLIMSLSVGYYYYTHKISTENQSVANKTDENKQQDENVKQHVPYTHETHDENSDLTINNSSDKYDKSKHYNRQVAAESSLKNISATKSFKPEHKESLFANNYKTEGEKSAIEVTDKEPYRQTFSDFTPHQITPIEAQIIQLRNDDIIAVSQTKPDRQLSETDLIAMQNMEDIKNKDDASKQKEKWMLGGQVAPLYSYRILSSDKLNSSAIDVLNEKEKGVFAYSGGICFAYIATNRLSVQTGIQYSKYGQEKVGAVNVVNTNYNYFDNGKVFSLGGNQVYQVTISNSTGTIISSSDQSNNTLPSSISRTDLLNTNYLEFPTAENEPTYLTSENLPVYQYFDYLEIPLLLKYKIIDGRIDLNILGGLNTNILVGNKVKIENNDENIYRKTVDVNKVNYSSLAGLGIEYPLNTNLFLNFEPRFIYYLNDIDRNIRVDVHPYSFGAFAGIIYLF